MCGYSVSFRRGRRKCPDGRFWSRRSFSVGARRRLAFAVLLCSGFIAGCGGSTQRATSSGAQPYRPLVAGEGALERVSGHWRDADRYGVKVARISTAGGGWVSIVAKRRGQKMQRLELEYNMQEPYAYGPGRVTHGLAPAGGGGGVQVNSPYEGVLVMSGTGGCLAGHRIVFAYGALSRPQDSVVVRPARPNAIVAKVPLPARLHAHDDLVYAVLPGGPKWVIVVKAPSGRVVYREPLGSISKARPCPTSNT